MPWSMRLARSKPKPSSRRKRRADNRDPYQELMPASGSRECAPDDRLRRASSNTWARLIKNVAEYWISRSLSSGAPKARPGGGDDAVTGVRRGRYFAGAATVPIGTRASAVLVDFSGIADSFDADASVCTALLAKRSCTGLGESS